jgi:hypothetical protein
MSALGDIFHKLLIVDKAVAVLVADLDHLLDDCTIDCEVAL